MKLFSQYNMILEKNSDCSSHKSVVSLNMKMFESADENI